MAAFDKTIPTGATKIRLSDDDIRANWDGLEDAIGRDHKFPTGYGTDAGEHTQITFNAVLGADVDPGTGKFAIYPKDNDAGDPDLFCQDEDDTVLKIFYGEGGTVMIFGQNSAPTGWTRKTDWTDTAMLCYAATGNIGSGGTANPQSTHTHGAGTHTHTYTGDGHTHTGPSHTHGMNSHTHSFSSSHVHGLNNHTHSFSSSHTHGLNSHTHSFNDGGHTHSFSSSHTHGLNSHTHTGPSHNHQWLNFIDVNTNDQSYNSGGAVTDLTYQSAGSGTTRHFTVWVGANYKTTQDYYTANAGTGNTGAASGNTAAGTASGTTGSGTASGTTGAAAGSTAAGTASGTSGASSGDTAAGTASGTTGAAAGATAAGGTGATGSTQETGTTDASGGDTAANTAPLYQEVIAATRDS